MQALLYRHYSYRLHENRVSVRAWTLFLVVTSSSIVSCLQCPETAGSKFLLKMSEDKEYEKELAELHIVEALLAAETAKLENLIAATAALGPLGEEILREYEAAVAEMGL